MSRARQAAWAYSTASIHMADYQRISEPWYCKIREHFEVGGLVQASTVGQKKEA